MADVKTIGVRAEVSHELHVAMVHERIARRYSVTMRQLAEEAIEFYFLKELPRRRGKRNDEVRTMNDERI